MGETSQKINNIPTIKRKIHEAKRLKNDLKENLIFALREYFTANYHLNHYSGKR